MTNSKSTKQALLLSALSILMCVAMLVGTTFAWFTDTASTAVNKIQAGTLDVALEMYDGEKWVNAENKTLDFVKAEGHENEAILWEPGCTYELPALRIRNKGNLALKYSIQVTGIDGDAKLLEVIDWTIAYPAPTEDGVATTSLLATGSNEGYLLPGQTATGLTISGHMQESAGNEYQDLSIDGIAITVYATQYTYEFDSYDNQYDALAPLPWDGKTVTDPVLNAEDGKYHITSAAEFAGLMSNTQNDNSPYLGKTIVLDCDIDLGGKTITGVGTDACNVSFTFDGQGHTVSNFTINNERAVYAGLFNQVSHGGSIMNLKVDNATVIGNEMVGVIASSLDGGASIDGCEVTNSTVVAKVKKAGAIAGYTSYGTVTNCKATNVDVYCADTREEQSGEIVGFVNSGSTVADNTATDVNVYTGTTVTLISTAAEFAQYINELNNRPQTGAHRYDMAKAVLVADIDLGGAELTPSGEGYIFSGSFDGRGHTVSNFTVKRTDGQLYTGLFSVYMNGGTIKNLTVKNATVIGAKQVAAIVPSVYENATVENCHAINCVTSGVKKVGAVAGLAGNGATIKDCSATGCSVTASNNDVVDANLFGYANGGTFTGNVDNGNNTLTYGE